MDPYLWGLLTWLPVLSPLKKGKPVKQLGLQAPGQHSAQASAQLQRPEGNDMFFHVSKWTRTDGWAAALPSQICCLQQCGWPKVGRTAGSLAHCCESQARAAPSRVACRVCRAWGTPGGAEEQGGGKGCTFMLTGAWLT